MVDYIFNVNTQKINELTISNTRRSKVEKRILAISFLL